MKLQEKQKELDLEIKKNAFKKNSREENLGIDMIRSDKEFFFAQV